MVESCTGTESHHSQLIGTASFRYGRITNCRIILEDRILDSCALVIDELEDGIRRHLRQGICLVGTHVLGLQRDVLILTNQFEIEVSSSPTSLVLIVVVLSHLLFIMDIQLIVRESLSLELIKHQVAIADTIPACTPNLALVVRRSPGAIEEIFNGITWMRIYRLIGGRTQHRSRIVTEVSIEVIINSCHEATHTAKHLLDVSIVVDIILLVVHLV